MATDPSEALGEIQSTDEMVRERMVLCLGDEAANRFFNEIYRQDLITRTIALSRAAKLLAIFTHETNDELSAPSIRNTVNLVHVSEPVVTVESLVPAEVLVSESVNEGLGSRNNEPAELDTQTFDKACDSSGSEKAAQELPVRADRLIASAFDDSYKDLQLTADDADAVVAAILEYVGKMDPRTDIDTLKKIIKGVYVGDTDSQIAHDTSKNKATISTKIFQFKERLKNNPLHHTTQGSLILKRHVLLRREDVEAKSARMGTEILQPGIDQNEDSSVQPITEADNDTSEKQSEDLLARLSGRLSSLYDQQLQESVLAFLQEDRFNEDMLNGKNELGILFQKYIPNKADAKEIFHSFSENIYAVLKQLIGNHVGRTNAKPQTLEQLLKWNQGVVLSDIYGYLNDLLQEAIDDQYVHTPKLHIVKQNDVRLISDAVQIHNAETTEPEETVHIDLFNTVKEKAQISGDEWSKQVEYMFDDAVTHKKLTRTQAVTIKEKISEEKSSEVIEEDLLTALQHLQLLSREAGCRINEDPEMKEIFNYFVSPGGRMGNIDEICVAMRTMYKREYKRRPTTRKLVGGIAAVVGA